MPPYLSEGIEGVKLGDFGREGLPSMILLMGSAVGLARLDYAPGDGRVHRVAGAHQAGDCTIAQEFAFAGLVDEQQICRSCGKSCRLRPRVAPTGAYTTSLQSVERRSAELQARLLFLRNF